MIDRNLVRVLVVALAARLVHAAAALDDPFVRSPIVDARTYLDWAHSIAEGRDPQSGEAYWQAPLFAYLLGALRLAWTGPGALLIAHALLGTLTVAAVYVTARRLLGVRGAVVAGAAAALYGPFLYFEGQILPATLASSLAAIGLLAATLPGPIAPAATGLALGLGGLAFPFVLAGVPGAAVSAARDDIRRGAVLLLAASLPVAPVVARNAREGGGAILAGSADLNFYLGNAPDDAGVRIRPGVRWERLSEEASRRFHGERGHLYLRPALAAIAAEPGIWGRGLARKAVHFWSGHERMRNTDPYEARRHSPLLTALLWERGISFPFGLVGPLALVGLGPLARRRGGGVLAAHALGVFLLCVLFFPTARYRLVALPALLVAAAAGVERITAAVRNRRAGPLAVFALLVGAAAWPWPGLRLAEPWTAPYHEGLSAAAAGRSDEALDRYAAAAALDPTAPEPRAETARLLVRLGRLEEADSAYREAIRLCPDCAGLRAEGERLAHRRGGVAAPPPPL